MKRLIIILGFLCIGIVSFGQSYVPIGYHAKFLGYVWFTRTALFNGQINQIVSGDTNSFVVNSTVTNWNSTNPISLNSDITFLENVYFDGNIGNSILHPDTIYADVSIIGGIKTINYSTDVVDDGVIVFPITTLSGWGYTQIDSAGKWLYKVWFSWDSDGTTTVNLSYKKAAYLPDVALTDATDGTVCFFDNGLGFAFKNRRGYTINNRTEARQ